LCGSDFVKGILQDSGNLKRVAWGLDIGTGRGRTSIKIEFVWHGLPLLENPHANFYRGNRSEHLGSHRYWALHSHYGGRKYNHRKT